MASILTELADAARERVESDKKLVSLDEMRERAVRTPKPPSFYDALAQPEISFICECKKASPSKGLIEPDFKPVAIAREYEDAGAAAISVLTEPTRFLGSDNYLRDVAAAVSVPVLRKDFTVDEYMIYQARALGASAVLLICSLLDDETLAYFLDVCEDAGLDALVEAHDQYEVERAVAAGARIIGVNNRNLADFTIDFNNSIRLRGLVPPQVLFVTESGIRSADDIALLTAHKVNAVLIGETLMRADDKRAVLEELKSGQTINAREETVPARTLVKCCGMFRLKDIAAVNEAQPDFCGFIMNFPKSHRSVYTDEAYELRARLDKSITAVGVFVNEDPERVAEMTESCSFGAIQLHGNEDEAYIKQLRTLSDAKIIKAFKIRSSDDIEAARTSSADYILLDNGQGTGKSFDWDLLEGFDRPYFLAGGLSAENIPEAIERLHPFAIDISSGLETEKQKDPEKIAQTVALCREASVKHSAMERR